MNEAEEMTAEAAIHNAFAHMCEGLANIVSLGFMPHLYHEYARVSEANSLYHFLKALETSLSNSRVYLEFSADEGRVDAVVVSSSRLIVVEAKSTISATSSAQIFSSLQTQAERIAKSDFSLWKYLDKRVIERFRGEEWGKCDIKGTWAVFIADTLDAKWKDQWCHLPEHSTYLLSYQTQAQENSRYSDEKTKWWHLLAFAPVRIALPEPQ